MKKKITIKSAALVLCSYSLVSLCIFSMTNLKLGLVRGNFSLHTEQLFNSLYEAGNFSDVTLVDEENNQIPAHKIILSSGCQFFRDLVLRNPHSQPLVSPESISSWPAGAGHLPVQGAVPGGAEGDWQFPESGQGTKGGGTHFWGEEVKEEVKEEVVKTEMKPFADEVDDKEILKIVEIKGNISNSESNVAETNRELDMYNEDDILNQEKHEHNNEDRER